MKLQHALDILGTWEADEAIQYLEPIANDIDILEIGTPLIIYFGMDIVRKIRVAFPNATILADIKIIDGGEMLANFALDAGADIVTVMGCTNKTTIQNVISAAHSRGKKVTVDMMCNQNLAEDAASIVELGADYICVHIAHDALNAGKLFDSVDSIIKGIGRKSLAVSGGIDCDMIKDLAKYDPEIIIIGSTINDSEDKVATIAQLKGAYDGLTLNA